MEEHANSYYANASLSVMRRGDGTTINGTLVVQVVEKESGTFLYALPPPNDLQVQDVEVRPKMVKETTEVVVDRAKRLKEENKALRTALAENDARIVQLQEQNRELQGFLM